MRIPNPRESTGYAHRHREIRYDSHDEDRVVIVLVVDENERHSEDEPCEAGCCAARVDTAELLDETGQEDTQPQRRPL